jgi:hypothetical protein
VAQRLLFSRISVFDLMQQRQHQLKDALVKLPQSALADGELAELVVNDYGISVPTLNDDAKYATTREVSVDVSQDRMRIVSDRSRPLYMSATEVTIHVPFEGDSSLFDVRPSSFSNSVPSGDWDEHELLLVFRMIDAREIGPEVERTIRQIRQYLDWLRPSAEQLSAQLKSLAETEISQRKQRAAQHDEALGKLGIPIRLEPQPPTQVAATKPRYKASAQSERWDVFISHASEDKDAIARPLAEELKGRGLSVWYDDFSLKLGDSLRQSIDKGLSRSQFGVVILSPRFFEKHWPNQELNGLATREVNGQKVILPVWHNVGFEEVCNYSPVLADRLAVSTDVGVPEVVKRILDALK